MGRFSLKRILFVILVLNSFSFSYSIPRDFKFNKLSAYNELSSYYVNNIIQDSSGYLWIATENGLNRFDGHAIKVYKAYKDNISTGLVSNQINEIFLDSKDRVWIGTPVGVSFYDREYDKFEPIASINNRNGIEDLGITKILEDKLGQIIVVSANKLHLFDERKKTFETIFVSKNTISSILFDQNNGFWLGYLWGLGIEYFTSYEYEKSEYNIDLSHTGASVRELEYYNELVWAAIETAGVISIDPKKRAIQKNYLISDEEDHYHAINIVKDIENNLWFIDHNGLKLYLPGKDSIKSYYNYPDDPKSLQLSVSSVLLDTQGNFYTTHKGDGVYVDYVQTGFSFFGRSEHDFWHTTMQNISAVTVDNNTDLWIGGYDGGINVFRWDKRKTDYYFGDEHNLGTGSITFLFKDSKGDIWTSSYLQGLKKFNPQTDKFDGWKHSNEPYSLSDNDVRAMAEDKNGNYWIATNGSGVDFFNVEENKFYNYNAENSNLTLNWVNDIHIDSKDRLWVATSYRISLLNQNDSVFTNYSLYYTEVERLYESIVYCIAEDSKGTIWMGTSQGIYYFDETEDKFLFYNKFINDPITSLEVDKYDNLWAGTHKGLFKVKYDTGEYYQFDTFDGLHGFDFNFRASYRSYSTMFFGGPGGVTYFHIDNLNFNEIPPKIKFTNFFLFNKKIENYGKKEILEKEINSVEEIVLDYRHNFFTIEFLAFNYINPQRNRYLCKLEGFDKDWIDRGNERNMSYTNLLPGKYVFKVKAANNDGVWNEDFISLKIRILPPWYLSIWFFISAVGVLVVGLIGFYKVRTQALRNRSEELSKIISSQTVRLRESNEILQQRAEDLKMFNEILEERQTTIIDQSDKLRKQADDLKYKNEELVKLVHTRDRMFSIIAHDLRSPFNTILGFTDLLSESFDKSEMDRMKQYAKYVHNASVSVFNLLENLLMWARSQTDEIYFNPKVADLDDIVLDTLSLVKETAVKKVQFIDTSNYKNFQVFMDIDMMRSVFRNILTNAIKFTQDGGLIKISSVKENGFVEVSITDNGVGIDKELIDKIMNDVEVESSLGTAGEKGVGMGLLLAHKFVKINGGKFSISSEKGKGSIFNFTLPIKE